MPLVADWVGIPDSEMNETKWTKGSPIEQYWK
jgi:hypothetical protein